MLEICPRERWGLRTRLPGLEVWGHRHHPERERRRHCAARGQGRRRGPGRGCPVLRGEEGQMRVAGCLAGLSPDSVRGGCCLEF